MKTSPLVVTATVVLTAILTCFATIVVRDLFESDDGMVSQAIASKALGETRQYSVHLPESYGQAPGQRYPVIYVLDAPSQDAHTAASAALMARIEAIPEAIVVGIHNIDGGRDRDFTPPGMRQDLDSKDSPDGRADRFLAFVGDELVPEIDRRYRTSSSRVLAGHSRGGLFVVYALTSEPSLFGAYVANSPAMWRDDDEMVNRLGRFLESNPQLRATLFLSLGGNENDKMKRAFQRTVATLKAHAPRMLRWRSQLTPGAVHNDNAELATPVGLRWALDPRWVPARMGG